MSKFIMRIFSILLSVFCLFILTSCTSSSEGKGETEPTDSITENLQSSAPGAITELNTSFTGNKFKVTPTDIKAGKSLAYPNELLIGIQFKVENVSNEELLLFNSSFEAYVDDAVATYRVANDFGTSLPKTGIAPGKFALGYYYVTVPIGSKVIEVYFDGDGDSATFKFDIPPVEESTTVS